MDLYRREGIRCTVHGPVQKRRNKVYCAVCIDIFRRKDVRCTVHGQVLKRRNNGLYGGHVKKRR